MDNQTKQPIFVSIGIQPTSQNTKQSCLLLPSTIVNLKTQQQQIFRFPQIIVKQSQHKRMSRRQKKIASGKAVQKILRRPTYVDNFVVQSRAFIERLNLDRLIQPKQEKQVIDEKNVKINGVDYFENEIIINADTEVLMDCVAVRGDYFYLKKGEIVKIRSVICEYAEVVLRGFKGYFPCSFFNIDPRYRQ